MRAHLYLIGAAVLWSTAGAVIKLTHMSAWQVAGGRSVVAALFFWAVFPQTRRWPSRIGWVVAAAYAATVVLFTFATKQTTAANAIFLQSTAPLYVLGLSQLVLGERPRREEWLSVPIFFCGLLLFFVDQLSPGQQMGNVLALASGAGFALMILGTRLCSQRGESGEGGIAWGNLLAALVCAPFVFSGPVVDVADLGVLLFLGVFQLGCSYALFSRALAKVSAVEASLIVLLEPVLNPVWTYLTVGERPGPWAIGGGALILGATLWRTFAPALSTR